MLEKKVVYCKIENLHKCILNKIYNLKIEYPAQIVINDENYILFGEEMKKVDHFDLNMPIYKLDYSLYKKYLNKIFSIFRHYSDYISFNKNEIVVDMSYSCGFYKNLYTTYLSICREIFNDTGLIIGFGIGYDIKSAKFAYNSQIGIVNRTDQFINDINYDDKNFKNVNIPESIYKIINFESYLFNCSELLSAYKSLVKVLSNELKTYSLNAAQIKIELQSINYKYSYEMQLDQAISSYKDFYNIADVLLNNFHNNGYLDHPYIAMKISLSHFEVLENIERSQELMLNQIQQKFIDLSDHITKKKKSLKSIKSFIFSH